MEVKKKAEDNRLKENRQIKGDNKMQEKLDEILEKINFIIEKLNKDLPKTETKESQPPDDKTPN